MSIVCTTYSYAWDLRVDWGLCQNGSFLRPAHQSMFPAWCYYTAAGTNLLIRLGWAVYISPNMSWLVADDVIMLLAAVELLRRFQWAVYRVEWEHVKHGGEAQAGGGSIGESGGEFGATSAVSMDLGLDVQDLELPPAATNQAAVLHAA